MKQGIHPQLKQIPVTCACKNQFQVLSPVGIESRKVESCTKCHSFYTGVQNLDLMTGRGGRFKSKHPNFRLSFSNDTEAAPAS